MNEHAPRSWSGNALRQAEDYHDREQLAAAAARNEGATPMEAPITILREYPDGHATVRAQTAAEASQLWRELQPLLADIWPMVPPAKTSQPPIVQARELAGAGLVDTTTGEILPPCPTHGPARVKVSNQRWGGVYCTASDPAGPKGYCTWSAGKRAA